MNSTDPGTSPGKNALEARLADALISTHPTRAAVVLERLGLAHTTDFIATLSVDQLLRVVPLLSPQFAAQALTALPVERIAKLLERLSLDVSARIARLLDDRTNAVLEEVGAEVSEAIKALLHYPEDTAGGLMDPRVLTLPDDLTAGEALERVRELSEHARYNLNIVNRNQVLVGVLNLRELLLAAPTARLSNLMIANPQRLRATASRANIVAHPGWREAHSLPVVDDDDRYLGTIRYRTLRRLEDSLRARGEDQTSRALGELLAVGAGGLVRAMTGAATEERD